MKFSGKVSPKSDSQKFPFSATYDLLHTHSICMSAETRLPTDACQQAMDIIYVGLLNSQIQKEWSPFCLTCIMTFIPIIVIIQFFNCKGGNHAQGMREARTCQQVDWSCCGLSMLWLSINTQKKCIA
jgi:hypothetical protein